LQEDSLHSWFSKYCWLEESNSVTGYDGETYLIGFCFD